MKIIENEEMNDLLIERRIAFDYAQKHFEQLKKNADNASKMMYGSKCDFLGQLCPSLINYRKYKNIKKGRFLKNIPQSDLYTVYEFDNNDNPLRLRAYNQYGCSESIYFYNQNEYQYAIPFIGETNENYGSRIYKYRYSNGRVIEYYEIEGSNVIGERYDYSNLSNGYVECYFCNYLNSAYSSISNRLIEATNAKLKKMGLNHSIDVDSDIVRRCDYLYRIFMSGEKILYIDEYKIINDELIFVRKI